MVEFALVLPLLLVLVTAIVEVGITYNHYVTLTDAARAGARAGAVSGDGGYASVRAAVKKSATGLGLTDGDIPVTYSGGDVTVTARHQESIEIFGLPIWNPTISSTTTERVEQ
jgi:Flp pilus assembly protein TadG